MTFSIRIPGATFTNFADKAVPYIDEATGFWLFGVDEATSWENLAPNAPAATPTITGTPVYGTNYVGLNPNNWVDTEITPVAADPYTYILVSDFARDGAYCGTTHSTISAHMWYGSGTLFTHNTAGGNANSTASGMQEVGSVQFGAMTRGASGRATYIKNTAGMQKTTGSAAAGGNTNSFAFCPASNGNIAVLTETKYYAAMLFARQLTDDEITDVYDYLAWKLARRSVVIL